MNSREALYDIIETLKWCTNDGKKLIDHDKKMVDIILKDLEILETLKKRLYIEDESIEIELIDVDKWVISVDGCVIICPECGERLELCYPDSIEVRYLPYCPYCGKKLGG